MCMWSPADICEQWERNLSFSSADVRGPETRDETLRTSAWEAIKKSVCGVSLTRAKRASGVAVSPQSHSPSVSASFQTFCLTARAYLNTQKYGLFCSLLSVLPICSKQALTLLIADCFQNGNPQDPNCNGIHGVLAAYYHSIERVQLHGNISDLRGLLGPVYKGGGGYPGDRVTLASWLRITLGKNGNSGWKIKWFALFRLESLRKHGLWFKAMQFFYSFKSVQLILIYL